MTWYENYNNFSFGDVKCGEEKKHETHIALTGFKSIYLYISQVHLRIEHSL